MTLTELRYIVAVANEHHFGRAAKACFVSQPTLSVAIKKLEEELGVAIFERGSNEVTLSPIGERIVQQAQQTLDAADNIKELALHGKNQLAVSLYSVRVLLNCLSFILVERRSLSWSCCVARFISLVG